LLFEHYSNTITNRQPRSRSAMMPSIIGDERSTKNNPSHYSAGGPYTGLTRALHARKLLVRPPPAGSSLLLSGGPRRASFARPVGRALGSTPRSRTPDGAGGRESSAERESGLSGPGHRRFRPRSVVVVPPPGGLAGGGFFKGLEAERRLRGRGGAGARGRGGDRSACSERSRPPGCPLTPSSKLRRRESRGVEGVSLPEAGGTFEREGSRRGQSERAVGEGSIQV